MTIDNMCGLSDNKNYSQGISYEFYDLKLHAAHTGEYCNFGVHFYAYVPMYIACV